MITRWRRPYRIALDESEMMRAFLPMLGPAVVFVLAAFSVSQAAAIERDLKITGTMFVAVFPASGKGAQEDVVASAQVKPDLALFFDDAWQAVIAPRFRLGITDSEFNLISLDDVYGEYVADQFELRVGYQTFFWGSVESANIVDILNQKDFTIDFFDPQTNKLGEPAIRVRLLSGEHQLDLYHFSYFTPASLPDKVNRFNFFDGRLDISDDPLYTGGAKRLRQQFALRWSHTIGSADVGLAYFNGYEKFPVVFEAPGALEADTLYYAMQQVSGDLQMSLGEWLLKGEAVFQDTGIAGSFVRTIRRRDGGSIRGDLVPGNHAAFVGGFEYTFVGILGKSDLGVIAEYLYDSVQSRRAVAFRPFQNDVFAGLRWSRNNPGDGELLAGVILDVRNRTQVWRLEYEERYLDRLKLEVAVDLIHASSGDPLAVFNNDDRLSMQLSYVY